MNELPLTSRQHEAVLHALKVRSAIARSNHFQLFRLINQTPNLGTFLLIEVMKRERLKCLYFITFA